MAVASGRGGTVSIGSALANVTSWSYSASANTSAWGSNDTDGYKDRVYGVKEASGSVEFKLATAGGFPADVGTAAVAITLSDGDGTRFSGNCFVDSISVELDADSGEVVGGTIEWSSDGSFTIS